MKKSVKILAVILTAVTVFSVAACIFSVVNYAKLEKEIEHLIIQNAELSIDIYYNKLDFDQFVSDVYSIQGSNCGIFGSVFTTFAGLVPSEIQNDYEEIAQEYFELQDKYNGLSN